MQAKIALKGSGTVAVLAGTVAIATGLESNPQACLGGAIAFAIGLLLFVAGRLIES